MTDEQIAQVARRIEDGWNFGNDPAGAIDAARKDAAALLAHIAITRPRTILDEALEAAKAGKAPPVLEVVPPPSLTEELPAEVPAVPLGDEAHQAETEPAKVDG